MSLFAKSVYSWRFALKGFGRTPFVHLVAIVAIAIALFLAGLTRGAMQWVDSLLAAADRQMALTVYLKEDTSSSQAEEIARSLALIAGGTASVVSPNLALDRLRGELGELGDVLKDLPKNPLPPSIEVRASTPWQSPQKMREVVEKAKSISSVNAVDYGEEAVRQLSAIASAVRRASLVAFAVAAAATLVIVTAALQLAIHSRKAEIEIQRLVGATDPFVQAPFLLEGLMQGFLGALIAIAGLKLFSWLVGFRLAALFSFLSHPGQGITLPSRVLSAQLFISGCVLGLLGSFGAVLRLSRR